MTTSILDEIIYHKRKEVTQAQKSIPLEVLKEKISLNLANLSPTPWIKALQQTRQTKIIAEIKRASPSRGMFAPELNIEKTALDYLKSGAAAISVLTEKKYFLGDPSFINRIKNSFKYESLSAIPLLRKDFIFEKYQIWESKYLNADALLLIVAILSKEQLSELIRETISAGLGILVEVHNFQETSTLLEVCHEIPEITNHLAIGINNRNLKTFQVDLSNTETILKDLHEKITKTLGEGAIIVSESGILSRSDIERMTLAGANTFLIGEYLVTNDSLSPGEKLKQLINAK